MAGGGAVLKQEVQKLLDIYHKLFNRKYSFFKTSSSRFYLENVPQKYALKMSTVRAIESRRLPYAHVIEPQSYEHVSKLSATSDDIENLYRRDPGNLAVTGSGGDRWILVTPAFTRWLEKLVQRMERV